MKKIQQRCDSNGFTFKKVGKNAYSILADINESVYTWSCKSMKECNEAIFQAVCLKEWKKEQADATKLGRAA